MHQPTKFDMQTVQGFPAVQCPWPVSGCWLGPQDHEHTCFRAARHWHNQVAPQQYITGFPGVTVPAHTLDHAVMGTAAH